MQDDLPTRLQAVSTREGTIGFPGCRYGRRVVGEGTHRRG